MAGFGLLGLSLPEIILAVTGILGILLSIFTKSGRGAVADLVENIYHGRFAAIVPHFTDLPRELRNIVGAAEAAFKQYGSPIVVDLVQPFQGFAKSVLDAQRGSLASAGLSTPENAIDTAATAFTTAFGAGLSSAAVTAAFEALFPEKLNTLNGVGPVLAQVAGFKEVAEAAIGPLYDAAFGISLEHKYLSQFRPVHIDLGTARAAFRRRLITKAQFEELLALNGIAPQYVDAEERGAYQPVSARMILGALDDTVVDPALIKPWLIDNGYKDADIDTLIGIMNFKAFKSLRASVVASAEANYIAGLLDDAGFNAAMDSIHLQAGAKIYYQLVAKQKRLKVLTEDYKRGWDAKYLAGEIPVHDYRVALAGLGYTAPIIDGIVGMQSFKLDAHEFQGEQRVEAAQRRKDQELAIQAALTAFHRNEIDAPALTAALLFAGLHAETVALYVGLAEARGRIATHLPVKHFTESQKLDIKAASEEYLKGVIDTPIFKLRLRQATMNEDDIADEVRYWNARGAKGNTEVPPTQP